MESIADNLSAIEVVAHATEGKPEGQEEKKEQE